MRLIQLKRENFTVCRGSNLANIITGNIVSVTRARWDIGNNTLPVGPNTWVMWTSWIWWWINTSRCAYKVISMPLKHNTVHYVHCVPKKRPPFHFSNNSPKLTDFNDFWCVKSWENLTSIACTFAHLTCIPVLSKFWNIFQFLFQFQFYIYF